MISLSVKFDRRFFWCHLYVTIELEGLGLDEYVYFYRY